MRLVRSFVPIRMTNSHLDPWHSIAVVVLRLVSLVFGVNQIESNTVLHFSVEVKPISLDVCAAIDVRRATGTTKLRQ